ncbi:ABC transporter permease subunit [Actinotalea sp. Marseille-Q4924]|uniref:ABC transporter permease subunit n=1 Tax=Actinotalea sp. Marseille-Q4924 TaxID=2866571 RepID=UPI001CE4895F|nr:ABC transporter permease subunit [Actinotalea sp. Marseille-Q4924]
MSSPHPPQVEAADAMAPGDRTPGPARPRRTGTAPARDYGPGFLTKLMLMALVNALGVWIAWSAWTIGSYGILAGMVAIVVAVDVVYFSRRTLPMKYILPGLIFLFAFQIFVVVYTVFVAFTNYGDGHNSTKQDAIEFLLIDNERRVEGSDAYQVAVVESDGGDLGLAVVTGSGDVRVGTAQEPLRTVEDGEASDGRVTEVPGYTLLDRQEILQRADEVTTLRVALSEDPEEGSLRTQDARNAYVFRSALEYDPDEDVMRSLVDGTVYSPSDEGFFVSPDGEQLSVGWRVVVGAENFVTAFSDARYAGPFVKILLWTFAFAFLSVLTTFMLGLFFAITFNDPRLRGRKIYRTLLILPYAMPGFLAALLWAGLLNRRFGFVNAVILGGAEIPWLTDPTLAKLSIIGVNLWLGFPYMFLICTGALQAIPADLTEAAKIDGAGRFRMWRSITLPLLLVSTGPLLISSFAFNFNNFTLVYMLTQGGPRFTDTSVPLGHTDILITMIYSVSGLDGSAPRNYGLASALSIVVFIIVATISALAFRRTRQLEEIN